MNIIANRKTIGRMLGRPEQFLRIAEQCLEMGINFSTSGVSYKKILSFLMLTKETDNHKSMGDIPQCFERLLKLAEQALMRGELSVAGDSIEAFYNLALDADNLKKMAINLDSFLPRIERLTQSTNERIKDEATRLFRYLTAPTIEAPVAAAETASSMPFATLTPSLDTDPVERGLW